MLEQRSATRFSLHFRNSEQSPMQWVCSERGGATERSEPTALAGGEQSAVRSDEGQAIKSARGMPWHQEPKKDATSCDKPRGAAHKRYIRGFPNGETRQSNTLSTCYE